MVRGLVRATQLDCYQPPVSALSLRRDLPKCNSLALYSAILDSEIILRVGGRLGKARVPFDFKPPILLPDNPLARSLVFHLHKKTKHQEDHILLLYIRLGSTKLKVVLQRVSILANNMLSLPIKAG